MSFHTDDHTILSASLPAPFLARQIGGHAWSYVENQMPNARAGVRVLVRRHRQSCHQMGGRVVITDYVTVRLPIQNRYGGWMRVVVSYLEGEPTPYPYRYDATRAPPPRPLMAQAVENHDGLLPQVIHDREGRVYHAIDFATPIRI